MREPDRSANLDRRSSRKRLTWVAGSLLFALVVLGGGLVAYVGSVNQVPPYTPPAVTVPVPNAYNDYMTAGMLVHETNDIYIRNGREPTTAALRKCLVENREALARLRAGFQHEYLNPPRYGTPGTYPRVSTFRSLARVVRAVGLLHEREGRPAEAVRCYLDIVRLGATIPRGGSLIHWLTGTAIQSTGLDGLQRAVDRLDAPSAKDAARGLQMIDASRTSVSAALQSTMEWDTAEMTGTFRSMRTLRDYQQFVGAYGRSGSSTPSNMWEATRLLLTPKSQIVRNYRTYMTQLADFSRQPYYTRGAPPQVPDDPYNRTLGSLLTLAAFSGDKDEALVRIVAVQLAARAYTLEHGAPPPNALALVPRYLDKVPDDPFTARPITLKIKDGTALVYSVGPDGVDDGGTSLKGVIAPGSKGDYLTVKVQP